MVQLKADSLWWGRVLIVIVLRHRKDDLLSSVKFFISSHFKDDPLKAKTALVRDTDNPDYNHRQSIEIHRSQRACQRIFKRQALKCEVFSKGGFLRSDTLIGTVTVKLQPLETQCEIHDSFPLMDGRKTVGGKLEVKIRVRNPILTKQIEQINEKWLIIDA